MKFVFITVSLFLEFIYGLYDHKPTVNEGEYAFLYIYFVFVLWHFMLQYHNISRFIAQGMAYP